MTLSGPIRRVTLRTRLLLSVLGVGVLLAALLVVASNIVAGASARSYQALTTQALPLAELHGLQSSINRIRVIEVELPQMREFFAVTAQLEQLEVERAAFAKGLAAFLEDGVAVPGDVAAMLRGQWERYNANLDVVVMHGMQMDMAEVARIAAYESTARFKAISRGLQDIAAQTETAARVEFDRSAQAHQAQMQVFMLVSAFGLMAFAVWLVWLWRALFGRLLSLRDAAIRVADGRAGDALAVAGDDELADLAVAFNVMQERVSAREQALREAQDALELRVQVRTQELRDSNARLVAEMGERQRAERQLLLLSKAVEQNPVGVMITDTDGVVEYVNPTVLEISGFALENVLGRRSRLFDPALMSAHTVDDILATLRAGNDWEGELHMPRADGGRYWEHMHLSPVIDADGVVTHFLAVREDITERKAQEAQIIYRAHHDALTDLPNRALAVDRLNQALRHGERHGAVVALLFIDLDNFKVVNDTLGHEAGDLLLVAAAQRIRDLLRGDDTVARHGGDEFLVILTDAGTVEQVATVAHNILQAFARPFDINGAEIFVTLSIGATLYPDDGHSVSVLLRNADLAMYEAKDAGRNSCRFFNQRLHDATRARMEVESCLRGALARDELHLAFQPVVAAGSGRIVGAEALLRWRHPERGWISPGQFIPLAEETGLIMTLGEWVIDEACRNLQTWQSGPLRGKRLAINISAEQVARSNVADLIMRSVWKHGIQPQLLELEMTESLLMRDVNTAKAMLHTLKDAGITLAIDDFGTGYSSLVYLRKLPISALKIDRSFVSDMLDNEQDRSIVGSTVALAHNLNLGVVAEGVEDGETLVLLREMGCDQAQGFGLCRPKPLDQLIDWLSSERQTAASR
ncbi:MAG: EAL domain-containing protein [Gammaproteobacteria bacterium]|nr:EAL domain-containing protein [Gammaproteobacteria bacterium]